MAGKDKQGKVLIVAGSPDTMMVYQSQLGNYQSETALTAETAMDRIDDLEPDVIVIDEKLPSVAGLELCQWIRSDQASPHYFGIILVCQGKLRDKKALEEASGADIVCSQDHAKFDLSARVEMLLKYKSLQDRSQQVIQKLQHSKETIRGLEDQDSITRLFNLPYMNARLEKECRHAEKCSSHLSLMIIGIHSFKELSHTKGPLFCIKFLQQLGNDLLHLTRADDIVGRSWGGEFLLILPETAEEGSLNLQNRINQYVTAHHYGPDPNKISLSLNFGISCWKPLEQPDKSVQDLLLEAEDALTSDAQQGSGPRHRAAGI